MKADNQGAAFASGSAMVDSEGRKGRTMFMADRRLFVIGQDERSSRTLARDLRLLCGIEFKALDQGIPSPTVRPDAVIVGGIALTESATIRKVERVLRPFLDQHIPVLCLMPEPTARDEVQARAAGATAVLASDTPFRLVTNTVRSMVRSRTNRPGTKRTAALRTDIEQVTCSLADLLGAAGAGRPVNPDLATNAGILLLQAVSSSGLTNWMDAIGHMHDPTYHHSLAMAGIMGAFVLHLGFNSGDCQRMVGAALLHDIGKALIPIELIDKPGPLSPEELDIVRTHAALGHELLVAQGGHDKLTLGIVRSHHECLDGSGYPDALHAAEIPDAVRIASLCDVFAALIEPRPYKPAMPPAEALEIMAGMTGKLDMTLLKAFRKVFAA